MRSAPPPFHPPALIDFVQPFVDAAGKVIPDLFVSISCPGLSFFPVVNNQTTALVNIYLEGVNSSNGPFESTYTHNAPYFLPEKPGAELLTFSLPFVFRTPANVKAYNEKLEKALTEMHE